MFKKWLWDALTFFIGFLFANFMGLCNYSYHSLSSVHFRVNIPCLFWFLKGKSEKACGKSLFPSNIRILFHFVEPPLPHQNLVRNNNYRPVSPMNSETKIHKKILVNNFSVIHNQYMLSPSGLYPWYEMKAQYSSIRCCKSLHQKR